MKIVVDIFFLKFIEHVAHDQNLVMKAFQNRHHLVTYVQRFIEDNSCLNVCHISYDVLTFFTFSV